MNNPSTRKYFYLGLVLAVGFLTVLILWPFAKVLVLSLALTAVLFPIYAYLKRKLKVSWVAALITVVGFIIVLCIPLFAIGTIVFKQSTQLSLWIADHGGFDNITRLFNRSITNLLPEGALNLQSSITAMTAKFSAGIGTAFTATLSTIFSFLLVILSMFYFLKDGTEWKKTLINFSPLSNEGGNHILGKLNTAVNGIIKGYLLIALVQGVCVGVGLFIFGVPNAALFGVLAGITSLVPTIGTALVTVPAFIFLLVMGRTGAAIGFAIWGLALVGTIDNMLNPIFVGKRINIHPLLVLFSVLGGIVLMGPIGLLVGPLAISFMYALMSVYKTEVVN